MREGRSGIRLLESIDTAALNCRMGGEVPRQAHEGMHRGHDRFARLALIAAEEAADQAGFATAGLPPERVAAIVGTGLGGAETLDAAYKRVYGENLPRVAPASIPWSMYNAAASAISTRFQAKGLSYAAVSACASSAHAIGLAAQAIRAGQADAAFAGGSDAPLAVGIIRGWESLRTLAIDNQHPGRACRPFDRNRAGLVLAEGAAIFVLEGFDHAQQRGQPILGEIGGFGATSDAGHLTDPSSDGAARAMRLALADAGITPQDVGYVNAHGTATRANDVSEAAAIRDVFAQPVAVSSTKSMHGHAMGASGAIEIACSLLALREGFLPPTINLTDPDPACDLDHVALTPRRAAVEWFVSNSFGFGGMNAAIAVRTLLSRA